MSSVSVLPVKSNPKGLPQLTLTVSEAVDDLLEAGLVNPVWGKTMMKQNPHVVQLAYRRLQQPLGWETPTFVTVTADADEAVA